jgi:hypothetical protein
MRSEKDPLDYLQYRIFKWALFITVFIYTL